jgi:RNA polymerase sigma factor (sigma-70 family)
MGDVTMLLPAALQGDRQAQDELYRLVEPELRKLALHWIRRYSAQERVRTTEVMDNAFQKLMQVESPGWEHRGQFYAFACRNICHRLIDLLKERERADQLPREGGDPEEVLGATAARRKGLTDASLLTLNQALESLEKALSPLHRQIVELKYMGECTLDEIEAITETDRSAVDRMLKIALMFLREKLESSFPDFGRFADED